MGREDASFRLEASIWLKGQFLSILKVTIKSIGLLVPLESRKQFVIYVLSKAAKFNKIHFIPWSQQQHRAGHPAKIPVLNLWMQLGAPPSAQGRVSAHVPHGSARIAQMALTAQKRAETADTNTDWTTCDMDLNNLYPMLEQTKLFTNWAILKEGSKRTKTIYLWFKNSYDQHNVSHHFGHIIGIFLARNLKNLFAPEDTTLKLNMEALKMMKNMATSISEDVAGWFNSK